MNIVDSSLWIEYFLENDIDQSIIDAIRDTGNLYVPIISLYEVYKKFITIGDNEKANIAVAIIQNAAVIGINPQLAVLAAQLGKQHKLPMADSIIYATAILCNAELYTQDKHFEGLDRVHYFSK
ncbi:MAG: type II toxin-antitoxin system VapC family toxin [Treponema sp.]|jgi:PIN domain nuclease of toxin-antitoxin system|nr:type II toxin-antitoxin system VapC family toxin [Treponema sp.]